MGIALLCGLFGSLFIENNDSYCDDRMHDTVTYSGFIAIEMINTMRDVPGPAIDFIDAYNETNCQGFVLLEKHISEKNYEQS